MKGDEAAEPEEVSVGYVRQVMRENHISYDQFDNLNVRDLLVYLDQTQAQNPQSAQESGKEAGESQRPCTSKYSLYDKNISYILPRFRRESARVKGKRYRHLLYSDEEVDDEIEKPARKSETKHGRKTNSPRRKRVIGPAPGPRRIRRKKLAAEPASVAPEPAESQEFQQQPPQIEIPSSPRIYQQDIPLSARNMDREEAKAQPICSDPNTPSQGMMSFSRPSPPVEKASSRGSRPLGAIFCFPELASQADRGDLSDRHQVETPQVPTHPPNTSPP